MMKCPFCGADGELGSFSFSDAGHNKTKTLFYVKCTECEDLSTVDSNTAEGAIIHWNHRTFSKETMMLRNTPLKAEHISNESVLMVAEASIKEVKKSYSKAYMAYKKVKYGKFYASKHAIDKARKHLTDAEDDLRNNIFIVWFMGDVDKIIKSLRDEVNKELKKAKIA
jgi:hypothetical protein